MPATTLAGTLSSLQRRGIKGSVDHIVHALGNAQTRSVAGPVFRFHYLEADAPSQTELDPLCRRISRRAEGIGSIYLERTADLEFIDIGEAQRRALTETLGGVPSVQVEGYAMANGTADWEALRDLAEAVAQAHGGWVVMHKHLPTPPVEAQREMLWRDLEVYFGAMIGDAEYVRANEPAIPYERMVLADARWMARYAVLK
jgi:hypothetical protein